MAVHGEGGSGLAVVDRACQHRLGSLLLETGPGSWASDVCSACLPGQKVVPNTKAGSWPEEGV